MSRLKRALIWLTRIRHVQGFGIQSPTDYRFVRYVINEHDPYYQYAELKDTVTGISEQVRKLCCLYFRLSNYCQPGVFVDVLPATPAYATYVKAGCGKTVTYLIDRCDEQILLQTRQPLLARVTWQPGVEKLTDILLERAPEGSVIVLESIKSGRGVRSLWKAMKAHPRVGATYDLYYCGIIITDNRRYKKNYIINF